MKEGIFKIDDYIFQKDISSTDIKNIVSDLASRIRNDYASKEVVYLVVLKGAFIFAADLIREAGLKCKIHLISASSYGSQLKSSGKVELNIQNMDIQDENIIIIEDIVDSGRTLKAIIDELLVLRPKSIASVCFLSKPAERKVQVNVEYIGKEIPPEFVIGYGLDYKEQGRHLPHIYTLKNKS